MGLSGKEESETSSKEYQGGAAGLQMPVWPLPPNQEQDMNLRERARGQECYLRIPGVCNHDPATVALCHIRRGHVAGGGQKPPDICALPACNSKPGETSCHDVMDRRASMGPYTPNELDGYILEGFNRWLAHCWKEGWIR